MPAIYAKDGYSMLGAYSDAEYEIVKKYLKPRIVDEHDRNIVHSLQSVGFMTTGIHETLEGRLEETAKVTPIGKRAYKRQKWVNTPVLSWLYQLTSLFS